MVARHVHVDQVVLGAYVCAEHLPKFCGVWKWQGGISDGSRCRRTDRGSDACSDPIGVVWSGWCRGRYVTAVEALNRTSPSWCVEVMEPPCGSESLINLSINQSISVLGDI